jgi:hypothetical protein
MMTYSGLCTEPQYLVSILVSQLLWTLFHHAATKSSNLPTNAQLFTVVILLFWTVSHRELHLDER